jgi:hypothetical protein
MNSLCEILEGLIDICFNHIINKTYMLSQDITEEIFVKTGY